MEAACQLPSAVGEGYELRSSDPEVASVLAHLSLSWCIQAIRQGCGPCRCPLGVAWGLGKDSLGACPQGQGPWPQERFLLPVRGAQGLGRRGPPAQLPPPSSRSWQRLQEPWPPARSGLCAFREQRQNKINWFPGRSSGRTLRGGAVQHGSLPVSPLPGALAVGSHILSAAFLYLVF